VVILLVFIWYYFVVPAKITADVKLGVTCLILTPNAIQEKESIVAQYATVGSIETIQVFSGNPNDVLVQAPPPSQQTSDRMGEIASDL
jgi:hypothetical protein